MTFKTETLVNACASQHGNSMIRPTDEIGHETLIALQALATHLGMVPATVAQARPNDLVSIYAVARGKGDTVAERYVKSVAAVIAARDPEIAPAPTEAPTEAPAPIVMAPTDLSPIMAQIDALRAELEALKASKPLTVHVTRPDLTTPTDLGLTHRVFPRIMGWLSQGVHVMAWGPAASGKTHIAEQCAQALGVPFYDTSSVQAVSELVGYLSPIDHTYHRTALRECYEHGGLFLFDEMDNSDQEAITAMNMLLANKSYTFPDRRVMRSDMFFVIAGTNTPGYGANNIYSSRKKIDGASITRFARVFMDYDEALEDSITCHPEWTKHVQNVRRIMKEEAPQIVICPRHSQHGGRALKAGTITWQEAEEDLLFAGLPETTVNRIRSLI